MNRRNFIKTSVAGAMSAGLIPDMNVAAYAAATQHQPSEERSNPVSGRLNKIS
jgi:hypothetical protein